MFNVCLVTKQTLIVWASQAPVRDQAKDHRNVANTVIYRNKSQVLNQVRKWPPVEFTKNVSPNCRQGNSTKIR